MIALLLSLDLFRPLASLLDAMFANASAIFSIPQLYQIHALMSIGTPRLLEKALGSDLAVRSTLLLGRCEFVLDIGAHCQQGLMHPDALLHY